jgi:hypothetical protein
MPKATHKSYSQILTPKTTPESRTKDSMWNHLIGWKKAYDSAVAFYSVALLEWERY